MSAKIAAQTARTPGWMYETCPLGGYQVKDGNGYVIAQFDREVLANQAVTRNNAHDDLVAALRKCEANLARNIEQTRISNFGDDNLLAKIRAALAKVGV